MLRDNIAVGRLLELARPGLAIGLFIIFGNGASAQQGNAKDTTPIVIGENTTGLGELPIYVALQRGLFQKAGVDVTSHQLNGGTPAAMAAFATGSVNILSLSAPELIQYIGKKVISGKAFAEVVDGNYEVVGEKAISNITDISGKTIGISGPNSGDWIFFQGLMQHYGISSKDVTFITVGNPANRLAALSAGAIQVTATTTDQHAAASRIGTILLDAANSPVRFPGKVLVASDDIITNHKPVLKAFLVALAESTAWIKANPHDAAANCVKLTGATIELCSDSIANSFDRTISSPFTWSTTGAINVDGFKSALSAMAVIQPDTQSLSLADVADLSIAGTVP